MHFFHCVNLLSFLQPHTPYLTKTSLPDYINAVEVVTTDFFTLRFLGSFLFLRVSELRKIDFETVLHISIGFLGNGGVAAVVLLFLPLRNLLALSSTVVYLCSARHDHPCCTIDACFAELVRFYREWVEGFC